MDRNFKILIVEHDASDIELLKYELRRAFPNHAAYVVQTEKDFAEALVSFVPDIVLSDYSLPNFDGVSAFVIKQRIAPAIPFILVSGTVGEENAVELIKSGITDYALKDKLFSLAPKVVRALHEAEETAKKKAYEQALQQLNTELEERVQARTAQLVEANTALEAFSYSVSHDLRSPLRSVLGFSQLIKQDHGHALNAEMRDMFGHIETSSKRMNAIIDDLLALAKCTKDQLQTAPVDMNQLIAGVWDNILFTSPHIACIEMEQLPRVVADSSMLEQVIVNLLSNAIKYSSKKRKPHIKVGCNATAEGYTFYVKDNGAGFDMDNYDRLFGAFQRLHPLSEFEGTGVGLMLIKRIIEKHEGKVWAEGKVDEGATFYFSLPATLPQQSLGEARRNY